MGPLQAQELGSATGSGTEDRVTAFSSAWGQCFELAASQNHGCKVRAVVQSKRTDAGQAQRATMPHTL